MWYGELQCLGKRACKSSDIYFYDGGKLLCNGVKACRFTNTYGSSSDISYSISSDTEYGMKGANIYSGINNTFIITLEGYESGLELDIYCEEGSNCTIICQGAGCLKDSTFLYCDNNALSCNYICYCGENYCVTQIDTDLNITSNTLAIVKNKNKVLDIENNINYNKEKYQLHLKYGGKPVTKETLNLWKNIGIKLNENKNKNNKVSYYIYLSAGIFCVLGTMILFTFLVCKYHSKQVISEISNNDEYTEYTPLLL